MDPILRLLAVWCSGCVVRFLVAWTKLLYVEPGDFHHRLWAGIPPWYVTIRLGLARFQGHYSLNRVAAGFISWGKGGNVTSARWQQLLCDPIWHVRWGWLQTATGLLRLLYTTASLMPLLTSTNTHLQSLHRLPGTVYLLPSVILAPCLPSKLLLKHISSTTFTRHATDSHLSAVPPIHSSMTYGAN